VKQARNDPVRIDFQILRPELIAGKQIELEFVERKTLLVKGETNSLAARRLRRVV
jgi:hypothetical protein